MKITKILMMLLLTSAIFVSCGPSATDDGKKAAELSCELGKAVEAQDMEKVNKINADIAEFAKEVEERWGDEENISEADSKAYLKAYEEGIKNCK